MDEQQDRSHFYQGAVIGLYFSVGYIVTKLIEEFNQSIYDCGSDRLALLNKLASYASDPAFLAEFDQQKGIQILISSFVSNRFNNYELCFILDIIAKIIEHDIVKWANLASIENNFIEHILELILNNKFFIQNCPTSADEDRKLLTQLLAILESAINNEPKLFLPPVNNNLPLSKLCCLLEYTLYQDIQQNVIALINAILHHYDAHKRREVFRSFKEVLIRCVINRRFGKFIFKISNLYFHF